MVSWTIEFARLPVLAAMFAAVLHFVLDLLPIHRKSSLASMGAAVEPSAPSG